VTSIRTTFANAIRRVNAAYRNWCVDNNRRPVSKQKFNRRVETLNPSIPVVIVRGTEHWSGLKLTGGTR